MTETTISIGQQLFDKRTEGSFTEYRHHINVGGRTVALYTRPSTGSPTTKYVLYDHQGSVDAVTDEVGGNYLSERFAPFGERRDPFDWTGPPPAADLTKIDQTFDRGYTQHTHLEGTSLIHMNGRVLDAKLGRFLSVDPTVPHPASTQSFNRYSYVQNNPLSRVDPSGFGDRGLDIDRRPYYPYDQLLPNDTYRDHGDTSRNETGGQGPGRNGRRGEGVGDHGCGGPCGYGPTALDALPVSDDSPAISETGPRNAWTWHGLLDEYSVNEVGREFRSMVEAGEFSIISFDKVVEKYLVDQNVIEIDATDFFHGQFFHPTIYINANRTNRAAALILYHEYQHSLEGGDEISVRYVTEDFAIAMGWPETGPGYRGADGRPDRVAIIEHYFSREAPGEFLSRQLLGQVTIVRRKIKVDVVLPDIKLPGGPSDE